MAKKNTDSLGSGAENLYFCIDELSIFTAHKKTHTEKNPNQTKKSSGKLLEAGNSKDKVGKAVSKVTHLGGFWSLKDSEVNVERI